MADAWRLSPDARADVAAVRFAGAGRWGIEQADRYLDGPFETLDHLAGYPKLPSLRSGSP